MADDESLSVRQAATRYGQSKRAARPEVEVPRTNDESQPDDVSAQHARDIIASIDHELGQQIERPTTGEDMLQVSKRLRRVKELGSFRDELTGFLAGTNKDIVALVEGSDA